MTGDELKNVRLAFSWTQNDAAERLGVTQAYLSMVERGTRVVSPDLASRVVKVFDVPPTALPLTDCRSHSRSAEWFKKQLGSLGYPGFAYLRAPAKSNPAELLMSALDTQDLDSRIVEALPWLPLTFPQMDWNWLAFHAKVYDRQNRLGFVVDVAAQCAGALNSSAVAAYLVQPLQTLERSRLAVEDTLCKESITQAERKWLRTHRTKMAEHWNLLSDLTVEQLNYAIA
jgi:transcriptional regulator with XRE-family HTH domain